MNCKHTTPENTHKRCVHDKYDQYAELTKA